MTIPVRATHRDARKAGWFSRRHKENTANREARETYQFNRGRKARIRRAEERR